MRYEFLCTLIVIWILYAGSEGRRGGRAGGGGGGVAWRWRFRGRSRRVPVISSFGRRLPTYLPRQAAPALVYRKNSDVGLIINATHAETDHASGRKVTFFCVAKSGSMSKITWFKDEREIKQNQFLQIYEWSNEWDNPSTIKSKLEIDPITLRDVGYYECEAKDQGYVDRHGFRIESMTIHKDHVSGVTNSTVLFVIG